MPFRRMQSRPPPADLIRTSAWQTLRSKHHVCEDARLGGIEGARNGEALHRWFGFGVLGDAGVNVLKLNLALDKLSLPGK